MEKAKLSKELSGFVKAVREQLEECETHCQHLPYHHIEYAEFKERFESLVDFYLNKEMLGK